MKHKSTKTYGPERGFSCCFRQHKANSHCRLLHGYALGFRFVFGANELDERNWVVDFGGLKKLEEKLRSYFDHTVIIAADDPAYKIINKLEGWEDENGVEPLSCVANVRMLPAVGCEAFAKFAFELAKAIVEDGRVKVLSCEVFEHGANSAIYEPNGAE